MIRVLSLKDSFIGQVLYQCGCKWLRLFSVSKVRLAAISVLVLWAVRERNCDSDHPTFGSVPRSVDDINHVKLEYICQNFGLDISFAVEVVKA